MWGRSPLLLGILLSTVAGPFTPGGPVWAQEFKASPSITHFVYRPGADVAEVEHLRAWTFGLGLLIGSRDQAGYGLVAHATYGGPYWYWAGSAGMWNSGSPEVDDFGLGVSFHYTVFQSRDFRTRLGPQFGWSASGSGDGNTHVIDYRVAASHAFSESLSIYGGLGAETSRISRGPSPTRSTNPSLLGGVYVRFDPRFAFSTGVESVFSDSRQLRISGSVQFETADEDEPRRNEARLRRH